MSIADAVSSIMGQSYGTAYTLRKANAAAGANAWTAGASAPTYVHCRAGERKATPAEVRGGMAEGSSVIVVDAATCAPEPKRGDRVALGEFTGDGGAAWRQVTNVYPAREGASVRVWRLETSQ